MPTIIPAEPLSVGFHAVVYDDQSSLHTIISAETKYDLIEQLGDVKPDRVIAIFEGRLHRPRVTLDF